MDGIKTERMNIWENITTHFNQAKEGYYFNQSEVELSYPSEGYDFCFEIEDDSYWFQHRNEVIKKFIAKHHVQGTFADIGGGNGFVTKALENHNNIEPILIEPAEQGCLNATKRGVKRVVKATMDELKSIDVKFNAIGLFDVIEHIEKVEDFLKQAKHTLLPNGFVFITVPAYQKLWSAEDEDAGHYRRYNLKMAKTQMENAGLQLIDHSYFFSILPLPILIKRALKKKGVAKKEDYLLPDSILGKGVKKSLNFEEKTLAKNKRIPFGSSLFLVAKI